MCLHHSSVSVQSDSISARDTRGATLVISDANRMAAQLLANALQHTCQDIRIQAEVTQSNHVVEQVELHSPSVVLISANLEDGRLAGFKALRHVHSRCPATRPIMLLDSRDRDQVVDAFRGGAKGVFFRTDLVDSLCKSIWSVHYGQIWAASDDLECTLEAFTNAAPLRIVDAKGSQILSKREEQVVALLAEGLSNREISERLHLSHHTVKNYLFRIFDKLGLSSRVELILYAVNQRQLTEIPGTMQNLDKEDYAAIDRE